MTTNVHWEEKYLHGQLNIKSTRQMIKRQKQIFFKTSMIIILSVVLNACSALHFDSTFPRNGGANLNFDSSLIGNYKISDSLFQVGIEEFHNINYQIYESDVLDSVKYFNGQAFITNKTASYTLELTYKYLLSKEDTIKLNKRYNKSLKILDSQYIVYKEYIVDTLINLYKDDKITFYNNFFYLNRSYGLKDWEIIQVSSQEKFKIIVGFIDDKDKNRLSKLIRRKEAFYSIAHLTNKQFISFIKNGGFRNKYHLIKIV